MTKPLERCNWVSADPVYIKYHDKEWGEPMRGNRELFEMLCLEGQQAGLSWITVLKKRDHYRKCFFNFDPEAIVKMKSNDVNRLLQDPGIIRHKGKIEAIIGNAKSYTSMQENDEDFSDFLWSFVNGKPAVNHWDKMSDVPTSTEVSDAMSKALKKKGFKFIGTTICYSFMQACGLVNDHITTCFCHPSNRKK